MVAESRHSVADEVATDPIIRREPLMRHDPVAMGTGPIARRDSQVRRAPSSNGLYDVLDLILDKGIVIDAFVRVSLVGIELVTIDLRVVVASVDTYLRYAEGVEKLQLADRGGASRLSDITQGGSGAMAKGAKKVGHAISSIAGRMKGDGEQKPGKGGVAGALSRGVRKVVGRVLGADDDEGEDEGDEESRGDRDKGNGHREQ